jgi:hypothetical protein
MMMNPMVPTAMQAQAVTPPLHPRARAMSMLRVFEARSVCP